MQKLPLDPSTAAALQLLDTVFDLTALERAAAGAFKSAADSSTWTGSGRSVQDVARRCGFNNAERMRRTFIRLFGAPPSAIKYRRR